MKCPYCDQEHPEGTVICPETGKPLGQLTPTEASQENQPVETMEVESTPAEQVSAGQESVAPEPEVLQATPAAENLPEPGMVAQPVESQPVELAATEPAVSAPADIAAVTPAIEIPPRRRHTTRWVIGGCIGIPFLIILILVLIAIIDPFNLHAWGRITGTYDAAAEIMPADTGMYLGINIGNGMLTHADRMITPFLPTEQASLTTSGLGYQYALVDPRRAEQATPFGSLLQPIEEETGVKIPEDLTPWIGQYAGIGVVNFTATDYGVPAPGGFILAIEARNLIRADAFLAKLEENLIDLQGMNFERQTYRGSSIYVAKMYGDQTGISFGRSGRMVMIATSKDILHSAMDQQARQALSAEQAYLDLVKVRPRDWTASLYFNPEWINSYLSGVMGNDLSPATPLLNPSNLSWTGMLMSVSAIKQGARLDTFVDFGDISQATTGTGQAQNSSIPAEQLTGIFPKETVVYLVSDQFNAVLDGLLNTANEGGGGLAELSSSLEQMLGFSLKEDLADQLAGRWALYAVPSTRGLLADQTNFNLAVSILVQTNGELKLKPITDGLTRSGMYTGITINEKDRDGFTYYELGSFGENNPMLAFGAGNGYFTLGTDGEILRVAPSEGDLLVKSDNYLTAIHALPNEMQPVLYIDLENLLANLREGMDPNARESFNESVNALKPIHTIVGGSKPLADNVIYSSIVVIISGE